MRNFIEEQSTTYITKEVAKNLRSFLVINKAAAAAYGALRSQLEKKGNVIGPLDMMIAAHAKALNTILVTNNKKEFLRVPKLKIEDWVHG